MTETDFHELVAAWLRDSFTDIEHEIRIDLPDDAAGSYVIADFIAYTPFQSYVIEVEDNVGSLETGLGQALRFAELTDHVPVVVMPADAWTQSRYGSVEIVTV